MTTQRKINRGRALENSARTIPQIEMLEYLGPMEHGQCRAQLFRGEDNQRYVVKFVENPCGPKALVNELFVAELAKMIGAPCPSGVIVSIGEELSSGSDLARNLCRRPRPGLHYGSRWASGAFPIRERGVIVSMRDFISNVSAIPTLIALDVLVRNPDRDSLDNVLLCDGEDGKLSILGVDHADCVHYSTWTKQELESFAGSWDGVVHSDLAELVTGPDPFASALARIDAIDIPTVRRALAQFPASWGLEETERESLVKFLVTQREAVLTLLVDDRAKFRFWTTRGDADG